MWLLLLIVRGSDGSVSVGVRVGVGPSNRRLVSSEDDGELGMEQKTRKAGQRMN